MNLVFHISEDGTEIELLHNCQIKTYANMLKNLAQLCIWFMAISYIAPIYSANHGISTE